MINEDAWEQTVDIAKGTKNETGATIITKDPPATAYSNEYVEKALAELRDEGVDVDGRGLRADRRHPQGGRQVDPSVPAGRDA